MRSLLRRLWLSLGIVIASQLSAQTVVPVHEEPRHRLVYEGDGFRVLDVRIPPGDTTLFHTHDAPITYVSIDASAVDTQPLGGNWLGIPSSAPPLWARGRVTWNLAYAREPVTHRVTTVGPAQFRLIAVVNHGPGAAEAGVANRIGEVEEENAWFSVARASLQPGESVQWSRSGRPDVAVLVTDGIIQASISGGRSDLAERGNFVVRTAGADASLRNVGTAAATLVIVSVR